MVCGFCKFLFYKGFYVKIFKSVDLIIITFYNYRLLLVINISFYLILIFFQIIIKVLYNLYRMNEYVSYNVKT